MICTFMRYTPMRYTLVGFTPVGCTPMRCTPMGFTPVTPAHRMYACGMHAVEVQIDHKRPYTGGRDLSRKIRVFALRDKRSLWPMEDAANGSTVPRPSTAMRPNMASPLLQDRSTLTCS